MRIAWMLVLIGMLFAGCAATPHRASVDVYTNEPSRIQSSSALLQAEGARSSDHVLIEIWMTALDKDADSAVGKEIGKDFGDLRPSRVDPVEFPELLNKTMDEHSAEVLVHLWLTVPLESSADMTWEDAETGQTWQFQFALEDMGKGNFQSTFSIRRVDAEKDVYREESLYISGTSEYSHMSWSDSYAMAYPRNEKEWTVGLVELTRVSTLWRPEPEK
ncbi:MAG: hypothetical protein R3E76_11155 [Planctomycetota bacterium]